MTDDRTNRIKQMRAEGKTMSEIGREFSISRQRVHQILNGDNEYQKRFHTRSANQWQRISDADKAEAIGHIRDKDMTLNAIASQYGVSFATVVHWKRSLK